MASQWSCGRGHAGEAVDGSLPTACPVCGAPCMPPTELPVGEQATLVIPPSNDGKPAADVLVPGYEILGELGRGGMGVVYKARHTRLNRTVALKMILSGSHAASEDLIRFRLEAEAVAQLQHNHIVQIYDVGDADGRAYLSLEFLDGGSLAQALLNGPLDPAEAARMLAVLARAVQAAHDHGIIHRDLKPGNILLSTGGTPKVTDFGLAKRLSDSSGPTVTRAIMGTPSYMSPEQADGRNNELGPTADVYALGAILYECLTGRPPFAAETALATIMQLTNDEPAPLRQVRPGCPRDLETICLKCLEKQPRRRYATARELAEDLDRYLADEPILARPIGRLGRLARWCGKQPALATTFICLSLFLVNLQVAKHVLDANAYTGEFLWFAAGLICVWGVGAWFFQHLSKRPGWTELATFSWCGMDVAFLTLLLLYAHGPRSAEVYFLLIGAAALRFRIRLVWFVTAMGMAGYLALFFHARTWRPETAVPGYAAVYFGVSLFMMGVICHLLLRTVKQRIGG